MKIVSFLVLSILLMACSMQSSNQSSSGPYPYSGEATTGSQPNVVPIEMGCGYINEPCVAVKFCEHGTTNCTLIDHVLLDTGSYGFRVFSSAIGSISLTQSVTGLGEVVQYADGTCDWGSVENADVYLGGEMASNVPIQVIDPSFGSTHNGVSTSCTQGFESDPQKAGFNAILGVGLFSNDCLNCATNPSAGGYYNCSSGTCYATTVPVTDQVTNPVALLSSTYNNGVMLSMSSVGSTYGSDSVVGGMTLGIDTVSGTPTAGSPDGTNSSTGVTVFAAGSTDLFFTTTYKGTSLTESFIDSGSNLWDFWDSSITPCDSSGSAFYCGTAHSLSATPSGGNAVAFNIDDANTVLNSNQNAYDNVGAQFGQGTSFDWGMPFYYGRNVFHLIKSKTGMGTTGPAWGFVNP